MIDPEKLRKAREAKGLNRSQLSLAAGLARNAVHRLEDGTRGTQAQLRTARAIANALGVTVESLAADPDETPPPTVKEPVTAPPIQEPEPDPEAWRWG